MQYTVEHYSTNGHQNHHHQQQQQQQFHQEQHFQSEHFHRHHPVPIPIVTAAGPAFVNQTNSYEIHETVSEPAFRYQHHPLARYESRAELKEMQQQQQQSSNAQELKTLRQEKHEKSSKKTIQQTTTTTTTATASNGQPLLLTEEHYVSEVTEPLNHITVQRYPFQSAWSNCDTFLHIFLTFFFGHLAAVLFFDGIIRNFANLYILEHTYFSQTIYVLHILFSIALIAFIIWFLTVCWRWWRSASAAECVEQATSQEIAAENKTIISNRATATSYRKYALIAALILILGFFIYLILGILDLSFKKDQEYHRFGNYSPSQYMCDVAVFIFRLIFWLVGIVALLLLSREAFYKRCCPSKHIKIGKEKPVTVYQVNA